MKKLEDYLHLYIGCDYSTANSFGQVNAKTLPEILRYLPDYTEFKLHLRRLSSMTEEEQNEVWHMEEPIGILEMQASSKVRKVVICPDRMKYLLSKGFDLFGLMDEGLAIDAAALETESHG